MAELGDGLMASPKLTLLPPAGLDCSSIEEEMPSARVILVHARVLCPHGACRPATGARMAQARAALWTNDDVLEESAVHGACSRFLRQARARVAARPRRTDEAGESAVPRWQTLQRTDPWNCAYVFQRRPVVKLAEILHKILRSADRIA